MLTAQMRAAITRYKYDRKRGRAAIFGRIVIGVPAERQSGFRDY
jgi:hypothetical protein